jgi:hypothetical protein
LQLRSSTTGLNRARIARLIPVALVALCIAGCQSNSERDFIARDQRRQEDQMWAMQDYIQQYQQLVCRFRSENAALRRQLNDERSGAEMSPQPAPTRATTSPPYRNAPPNQPAPGTQPNNQSAPPGSDAPDVPPLQGGSASEPIHWDEPFAQLRSQAGGPDRWAQLASYEAPSTGKTTESKSSVYSAAENTAGQSGSDRPSQVMPIMSAEVLLSGEVVANDDGAPRLAIDVQTFDEAGHAVRFDGTASLAIVNSANGVQQRLARWDFGPDDVRAAADPNAGDPAMHFRVELPVGTKIEGKNELLVRLVPTTGASLLSHARLDLSKPGLFSSRTDKIWQSNDSVMAASYNEPATEAETGADDPAPPINEGAWATAAPGKPANLPADNGEPSAGWRAANEPIPDAVVHSRPATKVWNDQAKRPEDPAPANSTTLVAPVGVALKPTWAPERPGSSPRKTRPTWSATR